MKKIRIAIITNIITTYRQGFYDRLFAREDLFVKVYCQDNIHGINLISIHDRYPENVKTVKFLSARKERIVWKFIPWKEIINNNDVVFVSGNPRDLSDAVFATFLRLFGKKVVLWTMAHSYKSNKIREDVRLFWSRIFKNIFVYTDKEVDFLRSKGFKDNFILGMNNGHDQKAIDEIILKWTDTRLEEWRCSNSLEKEFLLLSCARLETKNKFEQIIFALPHILAKVPNLLWCVIGDGNEKFNLEQLVKTAGLEDHVRFIGAIYKENELAPWFLSSEILIHPAGIGLTLQHALGFGLPVVTHGESKFHGPDFAAFEPEFTGRCFKIDDVKSLADTVLSLIFDEPARRNMKNYSLKIARERYNVDVMVDRFVEIAIKAYND
jgi:glycosyltransferase involved in cell wall biosynthesis